jgi:DNA primase
MAGIKNVVAPQGTALTADHARIVKRYVKEVVLCFDSDNAGQNATIRALDELLHSGLAIRVAVVPAPHDPDSYIRDQGGSAFQRLIARAPNFFDYYLERLVAQNDIGTDAGRYKVLRSMSEALRKTGQPALIDTYAQKTALRLGIAPEAVRAEFRDLPPDKKYTAPEPLQPTAERPEAVAELPPIELWLARVLLLDDDLIEWTSAHLELEWIEQSSLRHIISRRLAAYAQGTWRGATELFAELRETPAADILAQLLVDQRPLERRSQQVADMLIRLRNQHLDRQMSQALRRANDPQTPEAERDRASLQQAELCLLKKQPLKPLPARAPSLEPSAKPQPERVGT